MYLLLGCPAVSTDLITWSQVVSDAPAAEGITLSYLEPRRIARAPFFERIACMFQLSFPKADDAAGGDTPYIVFAVGSCIASPGLRRCRCCAVMMSETASRGCARSPGVVPRRTTSMSANLSLNLSLPQFFVIPATNGCAGGPARPMPGRVGRAGAHRHCRSHLQASFLLSTAFLLSQPSPGSNVEEPDPLEKKGRFRLFPFFGIVIDI